MVGIGIVGFGYWGPNYLRVLKQCDEVSYIAICDTDTKRLEGLETKNLKKYAQYQELLNDPSLTAVIIATPSPTHYSLAKEALLKGKHVLLEKPVTLTSHHAQELQQLAKNEEKVLLTGHIFLYNDGIDFLKKHIKQNEFGKIHEIECIRQGHGPIRSEINVMWDLATHDISILLYLLEHMPQAVSAHGFKYRKETPQEDSVVMTLQFSDQIQSIIKVNWHYPIKERRVTIIGSQQMIRFSDTDSTSPIIIYHKSAKPHGEISSPEYGAFKMITTDEGYSAPALKIREPLFLQIKDFLQCIENKKTPKSDGDLGINVVKILEAAQKSLSMKGAWVSLENATTNCELGKNVIIGKYSLVKNAKIGNMTKIWHYCNVYGTEEHPVCIGENCQIGSYSEIKPDVKIGNNCRMQSYTFIPEGIIIDDNVFIGPRVTFTNDKYPSSIKTLRKIWKQETTHVKENTTIGAQVVIGPGVTIGKCCIIGMGSVVVKDVPDYAVVHGNPAKMVGDVREKKYAEKFAELLE